MKTHQQFPNLPLVSQSRKKVSENIVLRQPLQRAN